MSESKSELCIEILDESFKSISVISKLNLDITGCFRSGEARSESGVTGDRSLLGQGLSLLGGGFPLR